MAWLEEYEFGRTYYLIMDIQLTEPEGEWAEGKRAKGKRVEPYEFESVLTKAERWNSDYLLCDKGKLSFEDLPEQPEGYQYWAKINGLYGELPDQLSPRERDIIGIARQIGYVEAMAERKLWWGLENTKTLQDGRDASAIEYDATNRRLKERYLELLGPLAERLPGPFPNNEDLYARDKLCKEFDMKRRTVNNRLINIELRKSVPKNKR